MTLMQVIKRFLIYLGSPVYKLAKKTIKKVNKSIKKRKLIKKKNKKIKIKLPKIKFKKFKFKEKRNIFYLIGIIVLFLLSGLILLFYFKFLRELPDSNLIYDPPKMSTTIYDRNGNILYKFYKDENRSWVSFDKIPQSLIWATLSIEDKTFYKHHGISVNGIITATIHNITNTNSTRGGSTITQQLVKNVFFDGSKTWERKIKEAILAIQIEYKLSKNEILERYFNQVAYGGETYGVQEASLKYFGKNVWEINMAEAAFLAGLPAAPSSYSPFSGNAEYAFLRQKHVINEMKSAGYIDEKTAQETINQKINLIKEEKNIEAPHFVFYIKKIVEEKFGFNDISRLGLSITTTLDINIQDETQKIVTDEVNKIKKLNVSNGAAIVENPVNGDILAMVGSKDYYANDIDGKVNVTTSLRQPGSSIKPINYLLAFQNGKTLVSRIEDSPVTYNVAGQKPYSPQNYNGKYMGSVTLKTALASSLNIPSVKLLAENGVENMIEMAEKMGITTWTDKNRFGLALALGSGEVKMVDMVQAYSVFADMGNKVEINPILEIDNYLGEVIFKKQTESKKIIEPEYAFLINNILSDNNARSPIFGLNSKLKINGKTVAVKTGTTNSLKDNWCIGWTPSYVVAAWVGNNDATPMNQIASGVTGATPIWNLIMQKLINEKTDEEWTVPDKIVKKNICGKEEYFVLGTEANISCENKLTTTTEK